MVIDYDFVLQTFQDLELDGSVKIIEEKNKTNKKQNLYGEINLPYINNMYKNPLRVKKNLMFQIKHK